MAVTFRAATSGSVSTGSSVTLTIPAAVQVGDMMLVSMVGEGAYTHVTPSGWNLLRTDLGAGQYGSRLAIYWKVATSGDVGGSATVAPAYSNSTFLAAGFVAYYGTSGIDVHAATLSTGLSTSGTAASATPTAAGLAVRIFAAFRDNNSANPISNGPATQRVNVSGTTYSGMDISDVQAPAGVGTGTPAATTTANSAWVGATVVLMASAPVLSAWANTDGTSEGSFGGSYATIGFCFTPTVTMTVSRIEVRWGTAQPDATGTITVATAATPTTPLTNTQTMSASAGKANTWEAFDITPVALTGGTEYVIAINGPGNGLVYKTTGASTFSGLTATRCLYGTGPSWGTTLPGYTGGFRLYTGGGGGGGGDISPVRTFVSNGDTNGMLSWLGTRQGTAAWVNPAARGWVIARQSTMFPASGPTWMASDRSTANVVHSTDGVGNWVSWDLGVDTSLEINHYSIRNRSDFEGHHLRNWVLEGTNDTAAITNPAAATWTVLKTHTAETALTAGVWRNWAVTPPGVSYRHFRVRNTGTDSTGNNYLTFGEIEFYGTATVGLPPPLDTGMLDPNGITNAAGTMPLTTLRTTVFDPAGVTGADDHLSLVTIRTTSFLWTMPSTWALPGRAFSVADVDGLGMLAQLAPRSYSIPILGGVTTVRTTGQIWPR